jgi:hypothetical protein
MAKENLVIELLGREFTIDSNNYYHAIDIKKMPTGFVALGALTTMGGLVFGVPIVYIAAKFNHPMVGVVATPVLIGLGGVVYEFIWGYHGIKDQNFTIEKFVSENIYKYENIPSKYYDGMRLIGDFASDYIYDKIGLSSDYSIE